MNAILEMKDIVKIYSTGQEEQTVLKNVNFTLNKGEFVSVLGPSGSGKSTLMNIIVCLDVATSGEYMLNGKEVEELDEVELAHVRNKEIGFVFQHFQLLPRLTAVQNVELPLIYSGVSEKERKILAIEMLKKVGLGDKLKNRPNQLSGGQQQRVAIARALVTKPTILLADEPTGALDQKTGAQIMELFKELHAEGRTIVMITHDEKIALNGSRIVHILDGELKSHDEFLKTKDDLEISSLADEGDCLSDHDIIADVNSTLSNDKNSAQNNSGENSDVFGQLFNAFVMIAKDEKMSETAGDLVRQFGRKLNENNSHLTSSKESFDSNDNDISSENLEEGGNAGV